MVANIFFLIYQIFFSAQADEKYLNAVEGLSPSKSKHEFYVDIAPDFGFPLAIRPRFQLNAVINRDPDVPAMKVMMMMIMMMIMMTMIMIMMMISILMMITCPSRAFQGTVCAPIS